MSTDPAAGASTTVSPPDGAPRVDRRARRRQETISEILDLAEQVMAEEGVAGLSLAEVARRLGVKPPSLYKYFDSLTAVYDALFERGAVRHLEVMRTAMRAVDPGLPALTAGLEAGGRWALEHPALAQLLFWRPVPTFEATPEAMAASVEMVEIQRAALHDAVAAGQLGPGAEDESAVYLLGILIAGTLTMAMANEPDVPWDDGRFAPLFRQAMDALPAIFPPD